MRLIAARGFVTLVALATASGCGSAGERDASTVPASAETLATGFADPVSTLIDALGAPSNVNKILAAVAARRVVADNDGSARSFSSVAVVDALGLATIDGQNQFVGSGSVLTEAERSSIVNALRPRVVTFISLDQVQAGIDAGTWQAALILASPLSINGIITVYSELWCGTRGASCADGGIYVLGVKDDGEWTVTKSNGGWIS